MDEEASQAAYCLLAMSRAADGGRLGALSAALGHQTVMEHQESSTSPSATAIPAASPQPRNAVVAIHSPNHSSPFMIARILTDLTRVRQDLFSVQPIEPPPSCKPSQTTTQGNTSMIHNISRIPYVSSCLFDPHIFF